MAISNNYFENPALEKLLKKADVVVYDLNGLIVDDEPLHLVASNNAVAAYYKAERPGEPIPKMSGEEWGEKCVGRHPQDWLPVILGRPLDPGELGTFIKKKDEEYFRFIGDKAREIVREGVLDLIKYISTETDKKLALATSSTPAVVEQVLGKDGLNISSLFEYKVCGDEVKNKKPHPEIYNKVKDHFEREAQKKLHFLVIEDAESGILSAKGAGMDCIAVPNRYTISQDLSKADAIIDNELPKASIISPSSPAREIPNGPEESHRL
jgi:HAD superfamily hydrolase (TIGR01509 family)